MQPYTPCCWLNRQTCHSIMQCLLYSVVERHGDLHFPVWIVRPWDFTFFFADLLWVHNQGSTTTWLHMHSNAQPTSYYHRLSNFGLNMITTEHIRLYSKSWWSSLLDEGSSAFFLVVHKPSITCKYWRTWLYIFSKCTITDSVWSRCMHYAYNMLNQRKYIVIIIW